MLKVKCDRKGCDEEWDIRDVNERESRVVGNKLEDLCDTCSQKLNELYGAIAEHDEKCFEAFMEGK